LRCKAQIEHLQCKGANVQKAPYLLVLRVDFSLFDHENSKGCGNEREGDDDEQHSGKRKGVIDIICKMKPSDQPA
jgi:hypothetical protein